MRLDLTGLKPWPISLQEKARIRKEGATTVEWQKMYDLIYQTGIYKLNDPTFREVMIVVMFVCDHYGSCPNVFKELLYCTALHKGY